MLYSLDDSYVGPSESTYYIESTDKDATVTVMDAYGKSTVTLSLFILTLTSPRKHFSKTSGVT